MKGKAANHRTLVTLAFLVCALLTGPVSASGVQTLDEIKVLGSGDSLIGTADSANQGTRSREQIQLRPTFRLGEILEGTPGLIVTQHSGEGKANQYFLRGFNLDHGTDLAITVDGVPVNMRTHGHGQGYSDLNFLIPELVSGMQYKKGPYYAEEGDFSAAGATHLILLNKLEKNIAQVSVGSDGFRRILLAGSPTLPSGDAIYGLEIFRNNGPWTNPDEFRKFNAVLRYGQGTGTDGWNVTAMAYRGKWNSTDQIPQRAVDSGLINRFDALDPTDGGEAQRYSVTGAWRRSMQIGFVEAKAYVVSSKLDLFSNFTYFLNEPVNGDQFQQHDKRVMSGFNVKNTRGDTWGGREVENVVGIDFRNDNIGVGLFNTAARQRLATVREDHVVETSAGVYVQNSIKWTDKFRTVAGLRGDYFKGDVTSDNPANSGHASDHIVNPKLSLIFGPWAKTEYYVNYGRGFHSNDVRGTTITVDPATGGPAAQVPLLVRTSGYEVGARTAVVPNLQSSLTFFRLDFNSELLFVGDAGTTEASRPSRRIGFEWTNLYTPTPWLSVDFDIAFARARFSDTDPAGNRVPGAVEGVATLSASIDNFGPWYGSARMRYFGPRPLIEDNTVRSSSTFLVSGRVGYKFTKTVRAQLDVFNLFNRRSSQIDYYYASRLPGEPAAGVADVHFHPVEPRSARLAVIADL
jgi:outer membrane receptor protein involved in Fe transport